MASGDTPSNLAITVEWTLPQLNSTTPPSMRRPITRHPITEPISIGSLVTDVENAKNEINDIVTHVIEKAAWPSLSPTVSPACPHGFPYTPWECLYSPRHHSATGLHPNVVIARYIKKMLDYPPDKLKADYGAQLDVPYSDTANTKIDFYGMDKLPSNAPVLAFVHGGYWVEGSRKTMTCMVPSMIQNGVMAATIGYDLAPTASMKTMVDQIKLALKFLDNWCSERASNGFYACGHSAGAHLLATAMLESREMLKNLKGMFLISGIYDLVPLIGTYIDRQLGLTMDMAKQFSPIHQIRHINQTSHPEVLIRRLSDHVGMEIIISQHDTPALIEQSRQFYELLGPVNVGEHHVFKDLDHFSVIERMDDPEFYLVKLFVHKIRHF